MHPRLPASRVPVRSSLRRRSLHQRVARSRSWHWLAGTWKGGSGALTFEERWTPASGGAMLAVSRTIKGDRMVAFEFLRIVEREGGLVYIAQPNGRPPTEFTLTAIATDAATFENPSHDFPKVIRYTRRPDGTLEARVSDGAQRAETFVFRRSD